MYVNMGPDYINNVPVKLYIFNYYDNCVYT